MFESFSWSKPKAANPSETFANTSVVAVLDTGTGQGSSDAVTPHTQLSSSATSTSISNSISRHFMAPAFTGNQEGATLVTSSSINTVSDIKNQILVNNNVAVGPRVPSLPQPGDNMFVPGSPTGLTCQHQPGSGLSAQFRGGHSAGISPPSQPQHAPGSKPGPRFRFLT